MLLFFVFLFISSCSSSIYYFSSSIFFVVVVISVLFRVIKWNVDLPVSWMSLKWNKNIPFFLKTQHKLSGTTATSQAFFKREQKWNLFTMRPGFCNKICGTHFSISPSEPNRLTPRSWHSCVVCGGRLKIITHFFFAYSIEVALKWELWPSNKSWRRRGGVTLKRKCSSYQNWESS